ncbi:MAG: GNAT family N-acetyltransferase [Proteobacteria bacterium]|nr:GNAT family N-acetyltransferase [Pseudomonadota bacterium]
MADGSDSKEKQLTIDLRRTDNLDVRAFQHVLQRSGLGERRPVNDVARLARMLANSNLVVIAEDASTGGVVGVARSVTDFAYCCYLSDLAVDKAYQGQGIGSRLIAKTRELAGPESMCLLLSAPGAVAFYKAIGMPQADNAFLYRSER